MKTPVAPASCRLPAGRLHRNAWQDVAVAKSNSRLDVDRSVYGLPFGTTEAVSHSLLRCLALSGPEPVDNHGGPRRNYVVALILALPFLVAVLAKDIFELAMPRLM